VPAPTLDLLLDEFADLVAEKVAARLTPNVEPTKPELRPSETLTTVEASALLGVSSQWLKVQRMRGTGPAFYRLGSSIRYPREGLVDFRAKRLRRSTSEGKT
jgi:Helix-turn-helix domain